MGALLHLARDSVVGDDFRVLEPLGAGGMGTVYVAEQLSTGKRRALKVMQQLLMEDPRQQERFVQEARVGARIESDHVVDVIAAGVDDASGVPWIAMELLDGEDLSEVVARQGALSMVQVLEIYGQLCHALGAAHRANIVHRDVKPQNVFLARTLSPKTPTTIKVLDFGIAKVAAGTQSTTTAMVGSPAWMAPEQTDPMARIAPAADVWALGLMAFWLLTGRSYWRSAEDPRASMQALMKEVLFDPLVAATERAASYDRADLLPEHFDEWFLRCVDREPAERFGDATELGKALEPSIPAAAPDDGMSELALMSTRRFTGSPLTPSSNRFGDMPLPPSSGATSPSVEGDRSSESAEPTSPAARDLGLQATARTPAGLARELSERSQARSELDRATASGTMTRVAPFVLSAVAGAAVVGAAMWGMSTATDPGRDEAAATPLPTQPPSTASATATQGAAPSGEVRPVPGHLDGPFAGADMRSFDPSAYMEAALAAARKTLPDAELMLFTTYGVGQDGRTDMTLQGHNVSWTFRSVKDGKCVSVLVTALGTVSQPLGAQGCKGPTVGFPKCTAAQAVNKATLGGNVQVFAVNEGMLGYSGDPDGGVEPYWWFRMGTFENSRIADDCGASKR